VRSAAELRVALEEALADPAIGLLLVTRDVAGWARERVDQLKVSSLTPLLVEIPGATPAEVTPTPLRDLVQRAVGVRLGG
jgi:vacuolar-type H+-ATPase subunit F/Vma7